MANPNNHEACCKIPTVSLDCPVCGKRGRKVGKVTLDHHLTSGKRALFGESAGFCLNPTCEAVYFNGSVVVHKGETVLPVTQKDPGEDVFVCYCFEHKRSDIRRDLEATGSTNIPDRIRKGIQEGRCDCERKNPQGACCLGNVAAAIKKIQLEAKDHAQTKD